MAKTRFSGVNGNPANGVNGIHTNGANGKVANGGSQIPMAAQTNGTSAVRKPVLSERTDHTRWRMLDEKGRQTWHYLQDDEDAKEWPQSTADKYFLGLPTVSFSPDNIAHFSRSTGTSRFANCENPSRYCEERSRFLQEPPTSAWELGLRIWWTSVLASRTRRYMDGHKHTDSRSCCNRN